MSSGTDKSDSQDPPDSSVPKKGKGAQLYVDVCLNI